MFIVVGVGPSIRCSNVFNVSNSFIPVTRSILPQLRISNVTKLCMDVAIYTNDCLVSDTQSSRTSFESADVLVLRRLPQATTASYMLSTVLSVILGQLRNSMLSKLLAALISNSKPVSVMFILWLILMFDRCNFFAKSRKPSSPIFGHIFKVIDRKFVQRLPR